MIELVAVANLQKNALAQASGPGTTGSTAGLKLARLMTVLQAAEQPVSLRLGPRRTWRCRDHLGPLPVPVTRSSVVTGCGAHCQLKRMGRAGSREVRRYRTAPTSGHAF